MKNEIDEALKTVLSKVNSTAQPHEILHLTQSALNLAHMAQVLVDVSKFKCNQL